jgi:hypothetical protein
MRAEVRGWWNANEIEGRPAAEDVDACCVEIDAYIGPTDGRGEELFSFTVCTPAGLERWLAGDDRPFWARSILVVRRYSREAVDAALNQFVRSVSGADWDELALKLNRFLRWEFEEYKPPPGPLREP